jgi:hypothetical protein
VDVILERFTPVGADIRLQRCRICDLTSVEQAVPSLLDHYHFCPARWVLHEWKMAVQNPEEEASERPAPWAAVDLA